MAKKIKLPLEMANGVAVRTLEELKENWDLEKIVSYYHNGRLLTWLNDRYYDEQAEQIQALSGIADTYELQKQLCGIFDIPFTEEETVDVEAVAARNEKLNKLRKLTSDDEILKNVDKVAFNQEELADLLDEDEPVIYLADNNFTIPIAVKNKKYVGVGTVTAVINSKERMDFGKLGISFVNIGLDKKYIQQAHLEKYETKSIGLVFTPTNIIINCLEGCENLVLLDEPSMLVFKVTTEEVLGFGIDAMRIYKDNNTKDIILISPFSHGMICDFNRAGLLLQHFLKKVELAKKIKITKIVATIPVYTTSVEKRAIIEALKQYNEQEVFLLERTMAAAIGAGIPVLQDSGCMVINLLKDICEASVICNGSIIESNCTIHSWQDNIIDAIVSNIREKFKLKIDKQTSEEIEISLSSALLVDNPKTMEIQGIDVNYGLYKKIVINENQICEAMKEHVSEIVNRVLWLLQHISSKLVSDIKVSGIIITGDPSIFRNIDKLISEKTGIATFRMEDADSVKVGTGICAKFIDTYRNVLN